MTGPYGADMRYLAPLKINHDAPKPGSGFDRDETTSMLQLHAKCDPPCPMREALQWVLAEMDRTGKDFARLPR